MTRSENHKKYFCGFIFGSMDEKVLGAWENTQNAEIHVRAPQ